MLDVKANWQVCLQSKGKSVDPPKVVFSMNRRGDIAFNDAAWIAIGRPTHVNLFYDAERRRIGFRKCGWDGPNVFKLQIKFFRDRLPREARCIIRARRLMKQFNIQITDTIRFLPPTEEKDGIYSLDLTTAYVPEQVKRHWRRVNRIAGLSEHVRGAEIASEKD